MIIQHPDPLLRKASAQVDWPLSERNKFLVSNLAKVMMTERAMGISAVQLGEPLRMFIAKDVRRHPGRMPYVAFINPSVRWLSFDCSVEEEGCLSIAWGEPRYKVKRHNGIRIEYTDLNGEPAEMKTVGMMARIIQHEIDHLAGALIIDKVRP